MNTKEPTGLTALEFVREFGAVPRPDEQKPKVKVDGCVGCGRLHGGVNAELECLRATVRRLVQGTR
jgi:hypothetical protein